MNRWAVMLMLVVCCGFSVLINAEDRWIAQDQKLTGTGVADHFGLAVSLSADGNIVAIGAPNSPYGNFVRVYQMVFGRWQQIGDDIVGVATNDRFGSSVALSSNGNILAVGAITHDGNGVDSGHVQIFENQAGTWIQVGSDIVGEAAADLSGKSVSLSADGSIVAIGAPENDGIGTNVGHVRVFENLSGIWTQIGADIEGSGYQAGFGYSVSLSSDGRVVAIGAPRRASAGGGLTGQIRVFENLSGVWTQIGNGIVGEAAGDEMGWSVAISSDGDTVACGAPKHNGVGNDSGQVRIYENQAGSWVQIGSSIDGETGNRAGWSVSLSSDGRIVAIGSYLDSQHGYARGHARVFENVSGTWVQIGEDIDGEQNNEQFGLAISLSEDGKDVAVGGLLGVGVYKWTTVVPALNTLSVVTLLAAMGFCFKRKQQ